MAREAQPSPLARHVADVLDLPRGTRVLAACSGGPDSLALLLLLAELARSGQLDLTCAHVHHGLRESDADDDRERVARAAAALGVPFVASRVDALQALARRRRGLEDAARTARLEELERLRTAHACEVIVLAHSLDDQAESVLLRLVRGAAPDALAGLSPRSGRLARPLLGVRRAELRGLLRRAGIGWSSDPTNWGNGSARAAVRELMARLTETLDARLAEHLARLALDLREDAAALDLLAAAALSGARAPAPSTGGSPQVELNCGPEGLLGTPQAVLRRVLRLALTEAHPERLPPSRDALSRVLELARDGGRSGQSAQAAGVLARRSGERLILGPQSQVAAPEEASPLTIPGRIEWPGIGVVEASLTLTAMPPAAQGARVTLDRDRIALPLVVRAARPGDRFAPGADGRSRRVFGFLRDRGVRAEARRAVPLVVAGGGTGAVVWVAGHGAPTTALATAMTSHPIQLEWLPASGSGVPS